MAAAWQQHRQCFRDSKLQGRFVCVIVHLLAASIEAAGPIDRHWQREAEVAFSPPAVQLQYLHPRLAVSTRQPTALTREPA